MSLVSDGRNKRQICQEMRRKPNLIHMLTVTSTVSSTHSVFPASEYEDDEQSHFFVNCFSKEKTVFWFIRVYYLLNYKREIKQRDSMEPLYTLDKQGQMHLPLLYLLSK